MEFAVLERVHVVVFAAMTDVVILRLVILYVDCAHRLSLHVYDYNENVFRYHILIRAVCRILGCLTGAVVSVG